MTTVTIPMPNGTYTLSTGTHDDVNVSRNGGSLIAWLTGTGTGYAVSYLAAAGTPQENGHDTDRMPGAFPNVTRALAALDALFA